MKPILYKADETAFTTNGIGILSDAIDCTVIQALNGEYELEMIYPLRGIHFLEIKNRCILLCEPDPVTDPQPFRIYRISKPMSGKVTVYARHIAYDMMGIPVSPFTAEGVGAALGAIVDHAAAACPFTFRTDKTTDATMTVKTPMSMWELLGGTAESILSCFGGEYEFDRWNVVLRGRRGADRGVSIRYGKNLTDLQQDENIAGCYTGVYPFWYSNGDETEVGYVELPEKVVHVAGDFEFERILTMDFSAEWKNPPTEDMLRSKTEKYIQSNDIGTPDVSWKVEFAQLEQTEEYRGKALLERVSLGDTVTVEFAQLGISATARAVETRYKPILKRYENVSLGKVRTNIADIVVNQQRQIDDTMNKTALQIAIGQLTAAILGAKGGAVRHLDTDGDGLPDTLYIADNPDPNLAKKVWRFNYEGWAASENGYNGPFMMGASLDTGFVADFITAGTLDAALVKIVNLIAEKLTSTTDDGTSTLKINGAELAYMCGQFVTILLCNQTAGMPILYMYDYDWNTGNRTNEMELTPHHLKIGGTSLDPIIHFLVSKGVPQLSLAGGELKNLSWQSDGQGKFYLMGE
ncbi:MAG: phage tail protein [Oscillospiraceae bacterium]|nr:phage tail protein [Oscillospiraceae bacterium]